MSNRSFAIGDIHGCARTLRQLLKVLGLAKTDTLYLLGDYIDRGPDSRGVIETILRMQEEGFDIRPICGNHEEMLLLAIRSGVFELIEWLEQGGGATLKSYGVSQPQEIPRPHLDFMENLPLFRETDRFVFVHAGLDFTIEDPFSEAGRAAMLWERSGKVVPARIGGRKMVSGHCTQTLDEIRAGLKSSHLRIDNGCVYPGLPGKGNLVALHLETGALIVQENIG